MVMFEVLVLAETALMHGCHHLLTVDSSDQYSSRYNSFVIAKETEKASAI